MFDHKEYVYRVYKEKSFSKAAESLYISQPSLSSTIKKAEHKLGIQLFDRSTTPVQLTEFGKEYIKCAEKIMDIENGFEIYLNNINNLKTGSLAVGTSNFFASYILPPIITDFKNKYPGITIDLVEASTASLERQLFAGDLDLIVDNFDFNENIYDKHFFYSERLLLAVPVKFAGEQGLEGYQIALKDITDNNYLDEKIPSVPTAKLANIPFVLLRHGNDTRVRADQIFQKNKLDVEVALELDQLATAYHLACYGMGATFISDTLIRETTPDERVLYYKVSGSQMNRINYFYYKQGKYLSKVMKAFLKTAAESVGKRSDT